MFDKNLFFALCDKYNVELSDSAEEPMIKDGNGVHAVTSEDVSRIFAPCQTFFGYSDVSLHQKLYIYYYNTAWNASCCVTCYEYYCNDK